MEKCDLLFILKLIRKRKRDSLYAIKRGSWKKRKVSHLLFNVFYRFSGSLKKFFKMVLRLHRLGVTMFLKAIQAFPNVFLFYKHLAVNIYLFKVNNRNRKRKWSEICSNLTTKTPERRQWRRSGIFIVNFEDISHVNDVVLVFLLLTLKTHLFLVFLLFTLNK